MPTKKSILNEKFSIAASGNSGRVHVVPSRDGWSVKKEGAIRASSVKSTKIAAVKVASEMKSATRVIIHKKDGTIQKNMKTK